MTENKLKALTKSAASLPVLMYHYVNRHVGPITVSPEHFEAQCRGMAENGWRGVGLDEAEAFLVRGEALPPKSVLITFDDGFLDNYVYAWPLLQRYGHKGVVFAVTDRLGLDKVARPTLAEVWEKKVAPGALPPVDTVMQQHPLGFEMRQDMFMNWEEARVLEHSGVLAVAAHSARHLAVFAGPEWKGLHTPGRRSNTFYLVDFPVLWGLPRFKERPFLHTQAFLPSDEVLTLVREMVPQTKAEAKAFFDAPEQSAALLKRLESFTPNQLGAFETDMQRQERLHAELTTCRTTLERELGHRVASFCWPWGGSSPLAEKLAADQGFEVFFRTSMGANPPGNPAAVHRFKVRDRGWDWLRLRLEIYSRPWLANLYARCRL